MFIKLLEKTKNIKENRIFSNSITYLLFSISTQVIGLIFTSILTSNLSVSDYGEYSLIISTQSILSIALTLSIVSGFSRFYNEVESKDKLRNSVINFLFLFSLSVLPLIFLFSSSISLLLLGGIEGGSEYIVEISILAVIIGITAVYETSYSMEFQAIKACLINFLSVTLRILVVFYFVSFGTIDIDLIINTQIMISLSILLVLFILHIKRFKLEICPVVLKPVLKFGLGLMFGSVCVWIITLIDRRFLAEYSGFEEVAIYSLASTVGMLITPVFLIPFRKVFTPFKLKVYSQDGAKLKIKSFYDIYCFLGIFCVLGLSLYAKLFVSLLGNSDYTFAINIIPLIAISYFLWGLNEFYGIGLIISNKSFVNSSLVAVTAILNIILNFILIPKYGVTGAAFSTIISYLSTNVLYFRYSRKYYNTELTFFAWFKFITMYLLIYSVYLGLDINIVSELFINLLLIVSYVVISYKLKFIGKEQFLNIKL
ncbi:membrane hypothetical protein [Vibrio nigripulchritudo SOn1]|uniref:Polysaccharide biosynthesis protein C-terminal domain-containing protein n=1 Tax=Vibrio nigripulchritudo SOn1 TaxID=1238450 RepID=A0AAV2VU82_9VIBR|nr:polysaccharide biosynthesis C-terminal domain-containing protein [Vibrio nigripulchritudo]CCO48254.1 membrane hypothetical protein [Vibrio nigripulchritudo SOn1]